MTAAAKDNEIDAAQMNADYDHPFDTADEEMSEANMHVCDSHEVEKPKADVIPRSVYYSSTRIMIHIFAESGAANRRSQLKLLLMLQMVANLRQAVLDPSESRAGRYWLSNVK